MSEPHLDHGLTQAHLDFVQTVIAQHTAFFITTLEMPKELDSLPCGLHGPTMGDDPILEGFVYYEHRGNRLWKSRMTLRPSRPTRKITIIAGPPDYTGPDEKKMVLYTAFGGPLAPQEPGDPSVVDGLASVSFWSQHALSGPVVTFK